MGLVTVFLITTGFVQPNIEDHAHILDKETRTLVTEKNNRYFQTKEQPQIVVITVKRLNKLTPKMLDHSKRTVFIVVGQKGKKRNVQIYSTKDLHSAFTEVARGNILRAEVDKLRSQNNATFNKGIRFVFRACATRVDQQYQYALDKYGLHFLLLHHQYEHHPTCCKIRLCFRDDSRFLAKGKNYLPN